MRKGAFLFLSIISLFLLSSASFAYPFPDTGQTKCYNNSVEIPCPLPGEPFYGQDAQYTCNPHSYTDLGNGIVRDNVTGLEWQQATAPGTYNWQQALDYVSNLNNSGGIGGYTDWRLPTIKELSTLVDSSIPEPGPTINTTYFPGTVASYYWSSTTYAGRTDYAWYVGFYTGYVSSYFKYYDYYVRAVRGGPSGSLGNLVINGNGTVSDNDTGLMWQQATAPGGYTWEQALTYCENLTLGGFNDWRLPNRNELQSIVDYTLYAPSINTTFFQDTVASYYWSSTTSAFITNYAWYVNFDLGSVDYNFKNTNYYVRAVRGGPCDSDGDGILDDGDNSTVVGDNPCTGGETVNCDDNCIDISNSDQADADNDGIGDACDNCPNDNNTNQSDIDGDGIGDVCDTCPDDLNNDMDGDTVCGDEDNCPNNYNPTQLDSDNDTLGNACDNDDDNDGVPDGDDNCAQVYNSSQTDSDSDGLGDACDNPNKCSADITNDEYVNIFDLIDMKNQYNSGGCLSFP